MVKSLFLPGAAFRPISYRVEAGAFKGAPLGWILHVAQMNGSPFDVFQKAKSPGRKFSTGWVAKDGSAEQYTTLDLMSWAQAAGNPWYWAFETEGYADEPLTPPQLRTLARWHKFLGTADLLAERPGDHGIGTHYMGKSAWGAHSCPDPVGREGKGFRSNQRRAIIDLAKSTTAPVSGTVPARPSTPTAPKVPPFPGTLRIGVKGAAVRAFQAQLAHRGWAIKVDGDYGASTFDTVRAFQTRKGLAVDGVVGPRTWAAFWTAK